MKQIQQIPLQWLLIIAYNLVLLHLEWQLHVDVHQLQVMSKCLNWNNKLDWSKRKQIKAKKKRHFEKIIIFQIRLHASFVVYVHLQQWQ